MLKTILTHLKTFNRWYDKQKEPSRFWWMIIIVVPGIWVMQSSFGIVSFFGMIYLIVLLIIRWAHVNGKF